MLKAHVKCRPLSIAGAILCALVFSSESRCEIIKHDFSIGLSYPGIGARYVAGRKTAVELKAGYDGVVGILGGRWHYYFNPNAARFNFFLGSEADYTIFKDGDTKGSGYAFQPLFLGGEYFINKNFSFQMDAGPAAMFLKDTNRSTSFNDVVFVINFALNWYFGKRDRP